MCKIVKKNLCSGIFSILKFLLFFSNLSKNYSAEFFLIFPVFSSKCDTEKDFNKKI